MKLFVFIVISSFIGEVAILYLNRFLENPKKHFSFDLSGILERAAIILIIALGLSYWIIPAVIFSRILIYILVIDKKDIKTLQTLSKVEGPAVEYQKIKIKSELVQTFFISPSMGIILGILAKNL